MKLIHKNKTILKNLRYETSIFKISIGLMFASKKKVERGICLVFPTSDSKYLTTLTNLFVFHTLDIILINSSYEVVDKTTLKPFALSYIPKKPCKYIIESRKNKFKSIKIGDKITLKP